MVLGGSTGQGKSVTLNSIIYGMCLEYAPWEITITLITQIPPIKEIRRVKPSLNSD